MNKNALIGLLAILLVFGMSVIGCDTGTTGNDSIIQSPFEGTWESSNLGMVQTWIFTGNEFLVKLDGINHVRGTFTYSNSQMTKTNSHVWVSNQWEVSTASSTFSYNIIGNTLTTSGEGWVIHLTKI